MIISTVAGTDLLGELVDGPASRGQLTVIGLDGKPLGLRLDKLVVHAARSTGTSPAAPPTRTTMRFAVATGVRPRVGAARLDDVAEAPARQQAGLARFRMVLTTG